MAVLIVGSLAYDSIETPAGAVTNALGGSATYGGLACQFHLRRLGMDTPAAIVGVVGEDFADTDREVLQRAGLDLIGLETVPGSTFRWEGGYAGSMGEAETKATHLNVFEHFQPRVPASIAEPKVLFCANLHPALQHQVMDQTNAEGITMLDSMNLWITIARDELLSAMERADLVIINDGEARMLTDDDHLPRAMMALAEMTSTSTLVVKRGEHGVLALHEGSWLALPAFPAIELVDPTGCGDSFAGTLAAHVAVNGGHLTPSVLATALEAANVTASFTLESFGTGGIVALSEEAYEARLAAYRAMMPQQR